MSLQLIGLSHSEIPGSKVICTYTGLIAAYHVLHRLREPRHPPVALHCFSFALNYTSSFALLCSFDSYNVKLFTIFLRKKFTLTKFVQHVNDRDSKYRNLR